jgi:glycerol-3-phosphate dehydrogenase (NAD(P)+)
MVLAVNHQSIRVAVIGAGSWGTTVASLAAENTPTVLWARRTELADVMTRTRSNPDYLGEFSLPESLQFTADMSHAVGDADVVVMAVPSHGFREVVAEVARFIRPWVPVVSLSKGLERSSLKRMSEVVADEIPGHPVAVLTGPNLAKEIMQGQPAAAVVSIND